MQPLRQLAQRKPWHRFCQYSSHQPLRRHGTSQDAQAINAAQSLLDAGVSVVLDTEGGGRATEQLRTIWTTLKELDPTSVFVTGVHNSPLVTPSIEVLQGPRELYHKLYDGLQRTAEQEDLDEIAHFSSDTLSALEVLERRGDSLAYGEITFEGVAAVLARIRKRGFQMSGAAFVDIGAGIGNVAVAAALLQPELKSAMGVEVLPGLHKIAQQVAERYEVESHNLVLPQLQFILGDAATVQWARLDTPTLVFMHATGFSDEFLQDLAEQAEQLLCPGSLIVALTLRLPSAAFELIDQFEVPCSWGLATTVVLRRIGAALDEEDQAIGHANLSSIVASPSFGMLLTALLAAPDLRVAREAAATLSFVARAERTARKLTENGALQALADLLKRGPDVKETLHNNDVLIAAHAATILALRSFGMHAFSKQKMEDVGVPESLRRLTIHGASPAIKAAAACCVEDLFEELSTINKRRAMGFEDG